VAPCPGVSACFSMEITCTSRYDLHAMLRSCLPCGFGAAHAAQAMESQRRRAGRQWCLSCGHGVAPSLDSVFACRDEEHWAATHM
jgi:hypothetical protein